MTRDLRSIAAILCLFGATVFPVSVSAQKPGRVTRTPGELVSAFAHEYQKPGGATAGVGLDVARVLTYPEAYPEADLDVFVRGLENLALTGSSSHLRVSSVLGLSELGSRRKSRPVPGTMPRLLLIYRKSGDPAVRHAIAGSLNDVAERKEALEFLEGIAMQVPAKADFPAAASHALGTLALMGEDGRAVLRRLHQRGAVRDPEARLELATLAKRGFELRAAP